MVRNLLQIKYWENWYQKYERPISTAGLLFGFVFDALTLKRVDLFWENFWVIAHLVIAAAGIIILNLYERKRIPEEIPGRVHFYLTVLIQGMFGGLFGTFLVFYFRSSTLATSWPFLLLLAIVFLANERMRTHYTRLTFQISILFISVYSFAIYVLPILFHSLSRGVFLLSGGVSLLVIALFLYLLRAITRENFKKSRAYLAYSIGGIFLAINILYFTNLIPPLPLSLKEAGVYQNVFRNQSGQYVLEGGIENTTALSKIRHFFTLYPTVTWEAGQPLYVYTAVFSPTALNTRVIHHWQHYNENTKKWDSINKINLSVLGGSDRGYRTYSVKNNMMPGKWRVDVETLGGQDVGRVRLIVK
jgi:hypothetical protein